MRSILVSGLLLCLTATPALAQSSSAASAESGSGSSLWEQRRERAAGVDGWDSFALVRDAWRTKWETMRGKLTAHIDRCHAEVRGANRDTLLPVTLQCYRGQILLERDALLREREVVTQWPGLDEEIRTLFLHASTALDGALQPVIDAIDAKVFTTLDPFRNVRANLLSQYRTAYGTASARLRADAALRHLDHLLVSLQDLAPQSAWAEVIACYAAGEEPLERARQATAREESFLAFQEAMEQLAPCPAVLAQAAALQETSSSSSSAPHTP